MRLRLFFVLVGDLIVVFPINIVFEYLESISLVLKGGCRLVFAFISTVSSTTSSLTSRFCPFYSTRLKWMDVVLLRNSLSRSLC